MTPTMATACNSYVYIIDVIVKQYVLVHSSFTFLVCVRKMCAVECPLKFNVGFNMYFCDPKKRKN